MWDRPGLSAEGGSGGEAEGAKRKQLDSSEEGKAHFFVERRENSCKKVKDFNMKAKDGIWP